MVFKMNKTLLLFLFLFLVRTTNLLAQENEIFYLLGIRGGTQDLEAPMPGQRKEEGFLLEMESRHGETEDREEKVQVMEGIFEFLKWSDNVGSGFRIQVGNYKKEYDFADTSYARFQVKSFLYGFAMYYDWGWIQPSFTIGSGAYGMNFSQNILQKEGEQAGEKVTTSYSASTSDVLFYEFGFRVPMGGGGLMFAWQAIRARMKVRTFGKFIELGGTAQLVGLYYAF